MGLASCARVRLNAYPQRSHESSQCTEARDCRDPSSDLVPSNDKRVLASFGIGA
jgi:hypothetical protein